MDNLFKLSTNVSDLRQLNLNFRELQEQFITGENERNTQFRINLRYFYDNFSDDLATINIFKSNILKHNANLIKTKNIAQESQTFIERLNFYRDNVLNQTKTQHEIEQLRKNLGFIYDDTIDEKTTRNQGNMCEPIFLMNVPVAKINMTSKTVHLPIATATVII